MVIRSGFLAVSVLVVSAFGQNLASTSAGFRGSAHFGAPPPFRGLVVTGAPYSGEEVGEQNQTLSDGTHISRKNPVEKVYRDSLGRTRRERPLFLGRPMVSTGGEAPTVVEIVDPVANVKLTLDPANRVAHRQELPTAAAGRMVGKAPAGQPMPAIAVVGQGGGGGAVTGVLSASPDGLPVPRSMAARVPSMPEKLGSRNIEGVNASGSRITMTWAVGEIDNDRTISSITETWFSPELRLVVLSTTNDPRSGERVQKLVNISRAEPSADLFQTPPGYTIVDEKDGFNISWGGGPQQ